MAIQVWRGASRRYCWPDLDRDQRHVDYKKAPDSAILGRHWNYQTVLTASPVIPMMPVCMLMEPNPGSRNERPMGCDGGIHHVWPFKFGAEPRVVIVGLISIATSAMSITRKPQTARYSVGIGITRQS